jgi:alkyldihydroxyacetonephosphate synthase
VDSGATLSHHHAVGTEHAQWLEEDISSPGVAMLRALFEGTDPAANLNPGKIVAADSRPVKPPPVAMGSGFHA